MTTIAEIAKAAFDGVSSSITDAILAATLSDGVTDYTGRAVFSAVKAPTGFPMPTAEDKVQEVILEGFSDVPLGGWTLIANGVTFYVLGVRDVLLTGGLTIANVIADADMLWQTVTFQRKSNTSDGAGGRTEAWSTLAGSADTGGIVAVSGSERYTSMRIEATSDWMLIVPYFAGLKTTDRVMIAGKSYRIDHINDHEKRAVWYVIDLTEGAAT
jgi:SPP1 family predicted phage head-tail adaptor